MGWTFGNRRAEKISISRFPKSSRLWKSKLIGGYAMEKERTSQVKISRLTVKGQMTLPKEYRDKLGVGPGDYVALLEVDEGILIKKATIFTETPTEKVLRETVLAFGEAAKKRGLTEEQLEQEIKNDLEEIRSEMYKEQYCGK
jgi:AbrB family looped-hinge helix DNA binding protein